MWYLSDLVDPGWSGSGPRETCQRAGRHVICEVLEVRMLLFLYTFNFPEEPYLCFSVFDSKAALPYPDTAELPFTLTAPPL